MNNYSLPVGRWLDRQKWKAMMYELVIIWSDGNKDVYEYPDRESAESAESGMRMALGNQIEWSCVRERR